MKKVFVFGANGLVGHKIVELLQDCYELQFQIRSDEKLHSSDLQFYEFDLSDFERSQEILKKFNPDTIVNAAAYTKVDLAETEVDKAFHINRDFVKLLTNFSKEKNKHLIQISTDYVFDGKNGLYKETDNPNPESIYAKSKYEADKYIEENLENYTILRAIVVYGYHKNPARKNFVTWLINELKNNRNVNIVDDQFSTFTYADDLASVISSLIKKPRYGVYHISNELYLNRYEFSCKIANILNLDDKLISAIKTSELNQAAKRPMKSGFIIDKAKSDLSFYPKGFEDTIIEIAKNLGKNE